MRGLFTYDPALDTLLPCKEIGLGFVIGDILQIVDQSDPNWWQAKKVNLLNLKFKELRVEINNKNHDLSAHMFSFGLVSLHFSHQLIFCSSFIINSSVIYMYVHS